MSLEYMFQIGEVVKIYQDDARLYSGYFGYDYGVVRKPLTHDCYVAIYKTLPEARDSHAHNGNSFISNGKLESTGQFNDFVVLSSI